MIATYNYDENGRRVYSKDANGETYYRYDGTSNHVLFEEEQAGNITKSYTYNASGHPLTLTYNGATYYYLTNYRGDVLALTDENGEIVAAYTYDAWGNILTQDGEIASINPYRYAGYRFDEQTKLYYLMARYYNPDTGVFMSLDPMRGDTMNPITMNGYNYANNNPVMMVDPDGNIAVKYYVTRTTYALVTGLIYVFLELVGGVTGINVITSFISSIMNYKVTVNARKVTSMSEAMSLVIKNPNYFSDIKKEARKTTLKFGIKTLLPLSAVTHSLIFATGITKGWKYYDKYNSKNMYDFGLYVYKNHGTSWF